ncbi:hypothetical protein SALBM135S_03434 [Streptomyces alboniger]
MAVTTPSCWSPQPNVGEKVEPGSAVNLTTAGGGNNNGGGGDDGGGGFIGGMSQRDNRDQHGWGD